MMVEDGERNHQIIHQITAVLQLLISESEEPYLGVNIPLVSIQWFLERMRVTLGRDKFEVYTHQQQIRDKYSYHITLITPTEYKKCSEVLLSKFVGRSIEIEFIGLGEVKQGEENIFFIVSESTALQNIRESFGLEKKDFHVTLGFKHSDIHDVPKGRTTLIRTPDRINYLANEL